MAWSFRGLLYQRPTQPGTCMPISLFFRRCINPTQTRNLQSQPSKPAFQARLVQPDETPTQHVLHYVTDSQPFLFVTLRIRFLLLFYVTNYASFFYTRQATDSRPARRETRQASVLLYRTPKFMPGEVELSYLLERTLIRTDSPTLSYLLFLQHDH